MIYDEDVVKTYWNVKHNGTLGMKNTKFRIINQHMNATSHMQSLEMTFTLLPLAPLTMFAPTNQMKVKIMHDHLLQN
jgi:hypothetical protein